MQIFLISFLGLFLEMLLIRWIGTEIRIFAYLQNSILVACFLGLGIGCLTSRKPASLRRSLMSLGLLIILMSVPVTRSLFAKTSELLSVIGDPVIWYNVTSNNLSQTLFFVVLGLALSYFILTTVTNIFVPIGRKLGRLMSDHPRTIWAYSINIAGSLVGTQAFVLLSSLYQPPVTWFAMVAFLYTFFLTWTGLNRLINVALLAIIVFAPLFTGPATGFIQTIWSPYQKLAVRTTTDSEPGQYVITVNNVGYQSIIDSTNSPVFSQYDLPLLLHPNPKSFLIVGAGAGNDAAAAARRKVASITAVEIDPGVISLGRSYHPQKPYDSPTVRIVNDDARAFFSSATQKYDIISFGLLDSHTTTSMTNARLDHYVYTQESLARARSLLAEGGVLVLSFEAQKPYITNRMAKVLRDTFGQSPIVFRIPPSPYGWGGIMFISGNLSTAYKQIAGNPHLSAYIASLQKEYPLTISQDSQVATDDWPYIYLDQPRIPTLYLLLIALFLIILARTCLHWQVTGLFSQWDRSHWHFFFLGAAFLLLEVQNISKASVALGNTWQVNAIIVSSVLIMILLANLTVAKFPKLSLNLLYSLLITICLSLYFVDLASFAHLPYLTKAVIVGALTTMPMFFSGIIFIRSFSPISAKDTALGANLIGALVGALLQSITFLIGIKALLLIVAFFYILSWLHYPTVKST